MSKPSIPAWQRTAPREAEEPKPENAAEDSTVPVAEESAMTEEVAMSEESADASERASASESASASAETVEADVKSSGLLDQASRFLEDANIRNAPREKKVVFLQAKGVSAEDIETLLGKAIPEDASPDLEAAGARAWSTTPPKPVEAAPTTPPRTREIPPIVTYPEFLAQTEKAPPLITTKRLVNTAYVAGGLMATIYGLSRYIVAPMAQDLAEARHDFATHTKEQLQELNKKLGGSVSVDPATKVKKSVSEMGDDVSEADSDPTELYHRDYGTQTTPNLSRRPSVADTDAHPTVTAHEKRLKMISSHLNEIAANRTNSHVAHDSLQTKVSDLTSYLNDMSYQSQYYSSMNGLYGGSYGLPSGKDGKKDQMEILKQDIRAVKGVFLSARNFPTGGPRIPGSRTPPTAMPTGRRTPPMPTGRAGT
ncbi:uncharacterized protein EKO05_0006433 [Ascochyta rabiei]|uniref:Peroxisomal membrane protein PEX14 n=1 Tax=Didymella rabiei TaxID=5454 RepID=A0A162WUM7_DIDRA|nr:uncharacterized protein EKO05_0006433 [Ascochyta rabiei]KZM19213.1 hypothetical protein ST47_g9645 [Ascochyta rabiei]UPX16008.1 hypothetical protein EKO05_0006433 [Ascochyta rabiei]